MTLPRLSTNAWTPSVFKFNSQTLFHSLSVFNSWVFLEMSFQEPGGLLFLQFLREKKKLLWAFGSWVTLLQAMRYWHLSMQTRPLLILCNMTSLLAFFLSSVSSNLSQTRSHSMVSHKQVFHHGTFWMWTWQSESLTFGVWIHSTSSYWMPFLRSTWVPGTGWCT